MARNGTKNGTLTAKQDAVAVLLAGGRSIQDAAAQAKVGVRTIKRWLAEQPPFARRVNELRAEMVDRACGVMADGMATAAAVLRVLLTKATASDTVKLSAARALLELGVRLRESVELEARVEELEQQLKERQP